MPRPRGEIVLAHGADRLVRDTARPISRPRNSSRARSLYRSVIRRRDGGPEMVAGKEIEACIQAPRADWRGPRASTSSWPRSALQVDVITGTIKAKLPTRISFQVDVEDRQPQDPGPRIGVPSSFWAWATCPTLAGGAKSHPLATAPFVSDEGGRGRSSNHSQGSTARPIYVGGCAGRPRRRNAPRISTRCWRLSSGGNTGGEDARSTTRAVAIVGEGQEVLHLSTSSASWASATTRPRAWSSRWEGNEGVVTPADHRPWASARSLLPEPQ